MKLREDITPGKNSREIVTVGQLGSPVVYPSHTSSETTRHIEWSLTGQSVDLSRGEITYTWTAV